MTIRIGYLTLAITLVLCASAELAGGVIPIPPNGPQEQYAFLIGVDSTGASVVPGLRKIADLLSNRYGYRRANIVEVYNELASLDSIRRAVGDIGSRISPADSLFVVVALPTAHVSDDVVAVPFNSDAAKPWTVLFTTDYAQWLAKTSAGQIAAIFPACSRNSRASFYAFEELRYARARIGTIQIANVCEERGAVIPGVIDHVVSMLLTSTERLDARKVLGTASAIFGQESVIEIGELRPFYFTLQLNKLQPLTGVVMSGGDTKQRVSAIQAIVAAVNAEPVDRRPALVSEASRALSATIDDQDRTVRLTAIWAAGIVGLTSVSSNLAGQFLSTMDQDEKRTIITALNDLKSSEVVNVIGRGLEDQSPYVRIATLRAAAAVRDEAVADRTLTFAKNDSVPEVRAAVLQVLPAMAVSDQMKVETAQAALLDQSPVVRRQAVATWAELGLSAATPALLAMLQNDPDVDVRQTVAYAIGRGPLDPENRNIVVTQLTAVAQSSRQQPRVREAAAWSLGRVGGENVQAALIGIVSSTKTEASVRAAAAESLGAMKSKAAVPALIEAFSSDSVPLRRVDIEALGEIGDERALDVVLNAVADKDPQVRALATVALNKIHPKAGSLDVLLTNLRDPKSPTVRAEAAQKLGAFRTPDVAQQLIRGLADPESQVRGAVIMSLSTFTDGLSQDRIRAALNDSDPRVQEGAVVVAGLQRLKDQQSRIAAIITNAGNPPSLRAAAVKAAPMVGADPAVVFNAARDLDPIVREASIDALREIPLDRSMEELKRLSSDDTPAVREKAIIALRSYPASRRRD